MGAHHLHPQGRRRGQGQLRPQDQGRAAGGHRHPGVPPRVTDRDPPRRRHRPLHRQGGRGPDHQDRRSPHEHRRLAPQAARGEPRAEEAGDPQRPRGGADSSRRGQEHRRLRRVRGPGRHRRPPAHHRHVLGAHQPPQRDALHRRRGGGQGAQVRPTVRAHRPRPEAEDAVAVGDHRQPLSARDQGPGRGGQRHVLRRLRQAGGRGRGARPCLRDVVDTPHQPPERDRQPRRHRGRGDPQRERPEARDLSRHEADRGEPLGSGGGEVPHRHHHPGPCPQPHQLRRVRGDRGGHRRPAPRQRHVLDPQGQPPQRGGQEGRCPGGHRPVRRPGQEARRPRRQAAHRGPVGVRHPQPLPGGGRPRGERHQDHELRRLRAAGGRAGRPAPHL